MNAGPSPTPDELAAIAAAYALLRQRQPSTPPEPISRWRRAARLEAVGRAERDLR
jgi:hypothetical protein